MYAQNSPGPYGTHIPYNKAYGRPPPPPYGTSRWNVYFHNKSKQLEKDIPCFTFQYSIGLLVWRTETRIYIAVNLYSSSYVLLYSTFIYGGFSFSSVIFYIRTHKDRSVSGTVLLRPNLIRSLPLLWGRIEKDEAFIRYIWVQPQQFLTVSHLNNSQ